jgi:hypothetical protein
MEDRTLSRCRCSKYLGKHRVRTAHICLLFCYRHTRHVTHGGFAHPPPPPALMSTQLTLLCAYPATDAHRHTAHRSGRLALARAAANVGCGLRANAHRAPHTYVRRAACSGAPGDRASWARPTSSRSRRDESCTTVALQARCAHMGATGTRVVMYCFLLACMRSSFRYAGHCMLRPACGMLRWAWVGSQPPRGSGWGGVVQQWDVTASTRADRKSVGSTHAHAHTRTHTLAHTRTHTRIHACTHASTRTCTRTRTRTRTLTRAHAYTHKHTHVVQGGG